MTKEDLLPESMSKEYPLLEVVQPIGTFFVSVIDAETLIQITEVRHRSEHQDSVQRDLSKKRVKDISQYCSDPDATFPTSIVVSLDLNGAYKLNFEDKKISINTNGKIGEIIDGQHRINGIKQSGMASNFSLPVVLMLDLDAYQKAYVFSIINSKQTSVPSSLIYDLFALSDNRSPFKTCHEITRGLNRAENSPFYNRLKMLGKKEDGQNLATISQGTFVKYLLELISRDPEQDTRDIKRNIDLDHDNKCSLRFLFIREKDDVIMKIILNIFSAVQSAFSKEWEDPKSSILSKPIGIGAILKLANEVLIPLGLAEGKLTKEFFDKYFINIKTNFDKEGHRVSSENYGSNEQARVQLFRKMNENIFEKENPS